jgi:putative transposase
MVDDWTQFFDQSADSLLAEKMRKHEQTGRPLGDTSFVAKLEKILERMLMPQRAGRKPSSKIQKVTEN